MKPVLVVGAGFTGAVMAREIAQRLNRDVVVIDQRSTIGGNCHTERDATTNILVHKYGPHIFNTNNEQVWHYVNQFDELIPYTNRVKASTRRGIFTLPVNLHTINQFFNLRLGPMEAKQFLEARRDKNIGVPKNFEEQALKMMGSELYEAFFRGYTIKQWGIHPQELPASLINRLPFRFNYNENYYDSTYQGIPRNGYTHLIGEILDHPQITIQLSTPYTRPFSDDFEATFYTGPLDAYFNFCEGRLGYRTVYWHEERSQGDFQGNAVMNYPDIEDPQTRTIEHKYFAPWEKHRTTVVYTEFSKETGELDIPYYPKRLESDLKLFNRYRQLALQESEIRNVLFAGRLATYRYLNMDQVIDEALILARMFSDWTVNKDSPKPPIFSNEISAKSRPI
jgi:UDP-galactopyranose mutase